ncbi:MAG: KH domain-containing protein [Oscillospiraceae bacterium]|jgi:predicted RNA-binding protein Jag|nr:KH domain-containing protein [Oscillospiraceae bacterium]
MKLFDMLRKKDPKRAPADEPAAPQVTDAQAATDESQVTDAQAATGESQVTDAQAATDESQATDAQAATGESQVTDAQAATGELEVLYAPETVDALDDFNVGLAVANPGEAPEPPEHFASAIAADEADPAELAETFLLGLLSHLAISADLSFQTPEPGVLNVAINNASDYGRLIGKRGEILDAIQRVTNNVVNRYTASHVHIRIDAGGYHAKRADTVRGQARRTASRVLKLRRNITMEPMNAFERHVVHEALQNFNGVSTYSTGTEPRRCVTVCYGAGKGGTRYGSR